MNDMIKRNMKRGFTLVELLAVIVILAIILVIAVPKIMNTIKDTTKASLESSAKMVAAQVENQYTVAKTLGKEFLDTGSCKQDWAGLNDTDYATCTYDISDGTAKVTLKGSGKFNGLSVCDGTRSNATATEEGCTPVINATNFEDDDWATIVAAVQSGNHPYQVGNTKTIELDLDSTVEGKEEYTIRVANTTSCSEEWMQDVEKSQTACGFVLEFVDIITKATMNSTSTNAGGWPASAMRTYLKDSILPMIQEEIGNGIIDTYVISSRGPIDTGTIGENKNFASTDKLYLLSPEEVYGSSFKSSDDLSRGTSRQLEYYEDKEVTTSKYGDAVKNYQGIEASLWWLRSAYSNVGDAFYIVNSNGNWAISNATDSRGVSPAFRLAD